MNLMNDFENDGFAIHPGFFPKSAIDSAISSAEYLVEQFAEKLKADGLIDDTHPSAPFDKRLAHICRDAPSESAPSIFRRELHLSGLFDIFFHPPLLEQIEKILGPEIRLYPNYSIRPKLPDHAPTQVLWHQDGGYTYNAHLADSHDGKAVEILRMVNVWAPLVPANEKNGCMQFIPGTHKIGLAKHERRKYYLEIDQTDLEPYLDRAVSIELNPGDLVLFHNMLYHQGLPNRSNQVRWSMDWRYQDATQPTLRDDHGHIARSRKHSDKVVTTADQWANLTFQ